MTDGIHCEKNITIQCEFFNNRFKFPFFSLLCCALCIHVDENRLIWSRQCVTKNISKQIIQIRMHFESLFILFGAVTENETLRTFAIHPRFICKWNDHKCTGTRCRKSHTMEKLLSIWLKAANSVEKKQQRK